MPAVAREGLNNLAHLRCPPLLSVSLGVRTTTASLQGTALECVEQVDKWLYKAKHHGRMRAEFADLRD